MAQITQKQWKTYISKLRQINDKAADEFRNTIISKGGYGNIDRQVLIDYAYGISTKYGEASAALSAQMYDAVAELSGVAVPAAVPAETATYSEVAKTVNGIIKNTNSDSVLSQGIGKLVKQAGADTILSNAHRDMYLSRPRGKGSSASKRRHSGAQVAWIPSGDTCPFCMILASKGWQRQTVWASDNHADHIHANCDCTYAVKFNDDLVYEGYEPEAYENMYFYADGSTRNEKINSMRRMQYKDPATREKINAQKRAAYAARNEFQIKRKGDTAWLGAPRNNSKEQIEDLVKYASAKGVVIDKSFSSFDGDIDLVKNFVDNVSDNVTNRSHMRKKSPKISLSYTLEDEVYAKTNGSNVTLNGFAYRDRKLLEKDYAERVSSGWFTEGSTYLDIATHESAHVIVYLDQAKVAGVREAVFGLDKVTAAAEIQSKISQYAAENEYELIAESYVASKNASKEESVLKVLRYCGIL